MHFILDLAYDLISVLKNGLVDGRHILARELPCEKYSDQIWCYDERLQARLGVGSNLINISHKEDQ